VAVVDRNNKPQPGALTILVDVWTRDANPAVLKRHGLWEGNDAVQQVWAAQLERRNKAKETKNAAKHAAKNAPKRQKLASLSLSLCVLIFFLSLSLSLGCRCRQYALCPPIDRG
jgi:hypothetical protein